MNKFFRVMVLGLAVLMGCQQPFAVVEEQKEPEGRGIVMGIIAGIATALGVSKATVVAGTATVAGFAIGVPIGVELGKRQ